MHISFPDWEVKPPVDRLYLGHLHFRDGSYAAPVQQVTPGIFLACAAVQRPARTARCRVDLCMVGFCIPRHPKREALDSEAQTQSRWKRRDNDVGIPLQEAH
eukprot:s2507_g2.t1